jgi:hypothetical protein
LRALKRLLLLDAPSLSRGLLSYVLIAEDLIKQSASQTDKESYCYGLIVIDDSGATTIDMGKPAAYGAQLKRPQPSAFSCHCQLSTLFQRLP